MTSWGRVSLGQYINCIAYPSSCAHILVSRIVLVDISFPSLFIWPREYPAPASRIQILLIP